MLLSLVLPAACGESGDDPAPSGGHPGQPETPGGNEGGDPGETSLKIGITVGSRTVELGTVTGYAALTTVEAISKNGSQAGALQSFQINADGTIIGARLDRLGLRFVVIDSDASRIEQIKLENFYSDPPSVMADASQPATLTGAGLLSPHCRGVMALAVDDATNRAIAVTVRLLRPGLAVMARVGDADTDQRHDDQPDQATAAPFSHVFHTLTPESSGRRPGPAGRGGCAPPGPTGAPTPAPR